LDLHQEYLVLVLRDFILTWNVGWNMLLQYFFIFVVFNEFVTSNFMATVNADAFDLGLKFCLNCNLEDFEKTEEFEILMA
jgi:hypothetical protein